MSVGCLTSQQQASVSQGRICPDNFTCCHTEIDVADPTFYLTQSQYTDTGPTSPSADPIAPGAWQGSHWSANFEVTGMTRPRTNPVASGIRTRDLPLSRRTPYHEPSEAVVYRRYVSRVRFDNNTLLRSCSNDRVWLGELQLTRRHMSFWLLTLARSLSRGLKGEFSSYL